MTITTTTSRNDYIASAAQTIFPYTFKILVDSDLEVYIDGTLKTLSTHYTVSGAGGSGGNVTFLTPMVGGENVAIIRNIPLTQETDYVENDPFPAETHEAALDKLTMIAQQVENRSQRSIRIPESDSTGTLTELPSNTARALKYLFFDSDGDAGVTAVAPTGTAVITPFWETVLDDASAGISVETIRNALSSEPVVSLDDEVFIRDTSATTGKRMTIENVLKAINLLTEDALPDNTADFVLTYDISTLSLKKVKPGNLIRHEPRRQTVVAGSVDANGQANFLSAGTGLAVSMAATTTPVVATFANGENEFGPINYRTRFSADQADYWSSLPASNTSFLMLDRNSSTGAISAYNTLVPPQYGAYFDKTKQALIHFEGADASTTMTDEYGNTWTAVGNAQIDTAQFKFGSSSLLLDGTGDAIKAADLDFGRYADSWTKEAFIRPNSFAAIGAIFADLPSAASAAQGFNLRVDTTGKLQLYASGASGAWSIASAVAGTATLATGTWYHILASWDGTTYRVFVDGVLDISVASTTPVFIANTANTTAIGGNVDGTESFNGHIDEIRFSPCARSTVAFTAPVAAFTPDAEWFDLSEFKWKFGGPTTGWTEKQRVCVGETVTGAATVSSATTYALRGRYDSGKFAVAVSTNYSKSHNLGVSSAHVRLFANKTLSDDAGDIPVYPFYDGGWINAGVSRIKRNTVVAYTHGTIAGFLSYSPSAGVTAGFLRCIVDRGW